MKKNKFTVQITFIALLFLSLIACDEDFVSLESDVINEENATNFNITSVPYDVITYTQALKPVQTNNLGLNTLGIYDDLYGRTVSSFVSQITTSTIDPDFGDSVEIDSVIITMPFFSSISNIDSENVITYNTDSIIGENPIKLSIFESNFFIRNFNPNGDFNENQAYFSDKTASSNETISDGALEGEQLIILDSRGTSKIENEDAININNLGFVLTETDDDGETEVSQRLAPGIRLKLDPIFWKNKIIDQQGETVLSSQNNLSNYFRGLYFKAETHNGDGSHLTLNVGSETSNITIYYSRLTPSTTDDITLRDNATFVLNFGPNRINFLENNFTSPINTGNSITGDSRLYLKGGEGSIAKIKLFNGEDLDGNESELNTFEDWKEFFVETTEDGKFVRSIRLVNEANLVFYVDQNAIPDNMLDNEPNRIFLYDVDNKIPLNDYFLDASNTSIPSLSRLNHLGPLQREDSDNGSTGSGIKYKLKLTEHINNLLLRDSTNVELGLSVSLNVNLEESVAQRQVQDLNNIDFTIPISSILTPRGTVLHGNNTENQSKKVYLEIYYTEPN